MSTLASAYAERTGGVVWRGVISWELLWCSLLSASGPLLIMLVLHL